MNEQDAASRRRRPDSRLRVTGSTPGSVVTQRAVPGATSGDPLLGVPGAVVWGVLAFFAELVPKLGG